MRKFTSIQTNLASNPQYKRYVNHLVGNSTPFFQEGSLYKMSYPYPKSSADNLIDSIAKVAEFEDKGVKMDDFFDLSVNGLAPTDDMSQKEAVGGYWLTLRNMMASTSVNAFQVKYEEPTIGYTYLKKYLEMYSNILEELKPSDLADTIAINDTHKILSPADLMTVKTSFLSEIKHYNFDDFAVVFQGLLRGFKDFGVEQQFTVEEMITVIDYALGKELNDSSHPTQLFSEFSEFCLERKVDHDSLYRVILQVLEDPYSNQDAFIPDFLFAVANLRVERDDARWLAQYARVLDIAEPTQLRKLLLSLFISRLVEERPLGSNQFDFEFYLQNFLRKYANAIKTRRLLLNQTDGLIGACCAYLAKQQNFASSLSAVAQEVADLIEKSKISPNTLRYYSVPHSELMTHLEESGVRFEALKFTKLGTVDFYIHDINAYVQLNTEADKLHFKSDTQDGETALRSLMMRQNLSKFVEVYDIEEYENFLKGNQSELHKEAEKDHEPENLSESEQPEQPIPEGKPEIQSKAAKKAKPANRVKTPKKKQTSFKFSFQTFKSEPLPEKPDPKNKEVSPNDNGRGFFKGRSSYGPHRNPDEIDPDTVWTSKVNRNKVVESVNDIYTNFFTKRSHKPSNFVSSWNDAPRNNNLRSETFTPREAHPTHSHYNRSGPREFQTRNLQSKEFKPRETQEEQDDLTAIQSSWKGEFIKEKQTSKLGERKFGSKPFSPRWESTLSEIHAEVEKIATEEKDSSQVEKIDNTEPAHEEVDLQTVEKASTEIETPPTPERHLRRFKNREVDRDVFIRKDPSISTASDFFKTGSEALKTANEKTSQDAKSELDKMWEDPEMLSWMNGQDVIDARKKK